MSSLDSDIDTATGIFKHVVEQVAKDRHQLEEDKRKCEEEKQKWGEEKEKISKTFLFSGQRIMLDVGGTRYSTSRSTLTKYPESMLGVMFSGRHDLETMKCSDGSFFIDRDGTHFRHILNYLRDEEEGIRRFPRSPEVLQEILHEAKYYQLDGLVTVLTHSVSVSQKDVQRNFISSDSSYHTDYEANHQYATYTQASTIKVKYLSERAISFKWKNMNGLSFNAMRFFRPVSFISCDLSNASFTDCVFDSDVTFENCNLDGTTFRNICGLVPNRCSVSFTDSNTEKAKFEDKLRKALVSAGKI